MSGRHYAEQVITDVAYMAGLLRRIQSARALVTIRINKNTDVFNTMVIDVSTTDKILFLDELNSTAGHSKIKKGTLLHFDGRLQGVRIQFSGKVKSVDNDGSLALYRLPFPEKMHYWQRRRHYRAKVHAEPLAMSIPIPLQHAVTGKIVDISASGVCTQLSYNDSSFLQAEQAIYDATISLPGRNEINCDLEVRSVRHFPERGYSLIGSEFIDIPPQQKSHVERIVAMLDRNHRRAVGH